MTQSTKHFKNCLGVFQGGGCKALAFVGAFKEAIARGVFFSSVAGTSAGSIIAALIAAGAEPDQLELLVATTDFNNFKRSPTGSVRVKDPSWARKMLKFGSKKHKAIAQFMTHLGLYSSNELEKWIELQLQSCLGQKDVVRFRDLNIPLTVVATELGADRPIIWSYDKTPDESVAFAVRCSCSIPVFFQPVHGKYVDGGIISNLPTFALSDEQNRGYEKLLCFTFSNGTRTANSILHRESDGGVSELSLEEYFSRLVSSVIDSAVTIQTNLQEDLHVIEIANLCLDTVDFDKIDASSIQKMFSSGRLAAKLFFDDEIHKVRIQKNFRKVFFAEPEFLNQIARVDIGSNDAILIALRDTRYVYNLYPTLLYWATKRINVQFFTPHVEIFTGKEFKHEKLRRLILSGLGVKIIETKDLEFEAFLFCKSNLPQHAIVLSADRKDNRRSYFAIRYNKIYDLLFLQWLLNNLKALDPGHEKLKSPLISFAGVGYDYLVERLKLIEQYSTPDVSFSMAEISVNDLVFLTKYIKSYKYNQISRLFDIYDLNNLELFGAVNVRYESTSFPFSMPMIPPVVEEISGKYYIIEGNSRLTYMIRERKLSHVKVIIVKNVAAPLPSSKKFTAKQVLISDDDKKGVDRFEDFDYSLYRKIEETVRDPSIYIEELS